MAEGRTFLRANKRCENLGQKGAQCLGRTQRSPGGLGYREWEEEKKKGK